MPSKLPRDPNLPNQNLPDQTKLYQLLDRLNRLMPLQHDGINHSLDGYQMLLSSLPTASAEHRGRVVVLAGAALVADTLYVCLKSNTDGYSWKPIVSG